MAITVTNRHASGNAADQSSYAFALSGLSTAGRWLVFDVLNVLGAGGINGPSLTDNLGTSLSYIQEGQNTAFTTRRLTRFYAWNPNNASFTLTVSFAGQTQNRCTLHVEELDGVDLSDPFVNGNTIVSTDTATATSGSVTLNAYAHANNRFIFVLCHFGSATDVITEEHTELAETANETSIQSSQWSSTTQDTTPSASWTDLRNWIAIGSEIKADVGGAPVVARRMLLGVGV